MLLEKLTVAQMHRNIPVFYGTRRFVAVFRPPLDPTSNTIHKPATVAPGPLKLTRALY
jgi:hypothetical protein